MSEKSDGAVAGAAPEAAPEASHDAPRSAQSGLALHANCVARDGHGVLLLGRSGAGKSDLALRLIDRGFRLVADDRVLVAEGMASPPAALAGLLEVRGIGILRMEPVFPVRLALVVDLDSPGDRLPDAALHSQLSLPMLHVSPWHPSAAVRIEIGLDCVLGLRSLLTGFILPNPQ